jgi:hypothetical protein
MMKRNAVELFIDIVGDLNRQISEHRALPDAATRALSQKYAGWFRSSVRDVIRILSDCGPEGEEGVIALWDALYAASAIGFLNTTQFHREAVAREQGRVAGRGKAKRRERDPVLRVIKSVVDERYRPGDEERPYRMASGMIDDINRKLRANHLPELTRGDRVARYLKSLKSPRS